VTRVIGTLCRLLAGAAVLLPTLDQLQAQQPRRQPGWPCAGKVDPAYVRNAEATGGKVFMFTPDELTGVADDLSASSGHGELVFRASDQLAENAYEYAVPIDSTIESAYFFVSLQCLESATLVRPNGEELRADAADLDYHAYKAVRLYTVKAPAPGVWRVKVAGHGVFSLIVSARSELRLRAAVMENGMPIRGLPVPGKPQRVKAEVSPATADVSFQFVLPTGRPLQALDLALEDSSDRWRTFAGDVTPPDAEFRLAATGTDRHGFRFQRMMNTYFLVPH
jgi:hypothetical protein